MDKKKLVLPGDHLSSYEEAEPAENAYTENDEVYSAAFGEDATGGGKASVKTKGRILEQPHVGMEVYCVITKTSLNKAVAGCIPVSEAESGGRGVEVEAVLPVTAIRRGYVTDIRHEVKIGDIIKAKIQKVTNTGIDISMAGPQYGLVRVFCPRCRDAMDLKDGIFISSCGWKERRKIPGQPGEEPPEGSERPERRLERRGGSRREFGRRPGFGRRPRQEGF